MSQFLVFDNLIKNKQTFKKVGGNFYKISTANVSDDLVKLLPVAQSWTLLNSLPESTKNSIVTPNGGTLVELAQKYSIVESDKIRNKTIDYYKDFFATLLIEFLATISDENFLRLRNRHENGIAINAFEESVTWESDRRKSLIKKAEAFSELLVIQGLDRNNSVITILAALIDQLENTALQGFHLTSIETQITTTLEKGMRYINQVTELKKVTAAAFSNQLNYENSKRIYAKSSLQQEKDLLTKAMLSNDPDELKVLLENYLKSKTSFILGIMGSMALTPFIRTLVVGINSNPACRRVFMESFRRIEIVGEELVSTNLREIGDASFEIADDGDVLRLLNLMVSNASVTALASTTRSSLRQ